MHCRHVFHPKTLYSTVIRVLIQEEDKTEEYKLRHEGRKNRILYEKFPEAGFLQRSSEPGNLSGKSLSPETFQTPSLIPERWFTYTYTRGPIMMDMLDRH